MNISDLDKREIRQRLKENRFNMAIGPFNISLASPFPQVTEAISLLYRHNRVPAPDEFVDFNLEIYPPQTLRRWYKPQVYFSFNRFKPFKPLPADQAFALFEWGLNWVIATNAHQFTIIHSAVIANNDQAIIMPGTPGSGKSTLCAAMMLSGWKLLSDEMALLNDDGKTLTPIPRPVSLKNESIDIIHARYPDCPFGPIAHDTSKGTVAHIPASKTSVESAAIPATARLIILPKFRAGSETRLTTLSRSAAFMQMMENTFNYHIQGKAAGDRISHLLAQIPAYQLSYSNMDEAMQTLEQLLKKHHD